MFCVKCGTRLRNDYRFCFQCGMKVPMINYIEVDTEEYGDGFISKENSWETMLLSESETTLLAEKCINNIGDDEENETTLLSSNVIMKSKNGKDGKTQIPISAPRMVIKNILSHKEKVMEQFPLIIGSDIEKADFYISNSTISRCHATIVYKDKEYYIIDNYSTNNTMIDGRIIEPGETIRLYNGAILQLSDELLQIMIEDEGDDKNKIYSSGTF